MPVVFDQITCNNKKPRSQWKDRFIYTILGLFAGMTGAHNFYLRRYFPACAQLLLSVFWIVCLSVRPATLFCAKLFMMTACIVFLFEIIWITAELFYVRREPDGDAMNDELRPIRILFILLFWLTFILLPLGFSLAMNGISVFLEPIEERLHSAPQSN